MMKRVFCLFSLSFVFLAFNPAADASSACESVTAENPGPTADCLVFMEAFSGPNVEPIALDRYTLSFYSFWRVGPDAVNLYDGPGGSMVGQIPPGFNFVRALDTSVDDWLQIEGGQWVSRLEAELTQPSPFRGVQLSNGLERPFAWVVDTTGIYASEYPSGPPSQATGRVPLRYEIVNIFAEAVDSEGWTWYMIGADQWVNQRFVSVIKGVERPEGVSGRWVAVDLYEQTLVAYEDDSPVFATLVSTGLPGWDTNEGVFTVWARLEVDGMSGATGAPDAYALQSIPWIQYFDNDISLHGTYWHDLFGYRRSHGCVNMSISDARFVYQWLGDAEPDENDDVQHYVYVHSSGTYTNQQG
ncbi:MAG: hypothetical protein CL610_15460 [Anaerolineaceae bacterium]|nr:hypothetical protein [Anaerolineaceae bacterium]